MQIKTTTGVVLLVSYNMGAIECNCTHDINGTENPTTVHFSLVNPIACRDMGILPPSYNMASIIEDDKAKG